MQRKPIKPSAPPATMYAPVRLWQGREYISTTEIRSTATDCEKWLEQSNPDELVRIAKIVITEVAQ